MEQGGNEVRIQPEDRLILIVILSVTVIAYAPLLKSVWDLSAQTTQAVNALLLLAVAFVDALVSVLKRHPFRPSINAHGLCLLGLSFLALTVSSLMSVWVFASLGLCLNVGALLSFCFGRSGVRGFYPALAGFGVMVLMLVMVPQFDSRLRLMAGKVAAWMLPWLGIRAELLVQWDPFQVMLVAEKGAGVFNVATECNGFGILMSSIVLALILGLRRGVQWCRVLPLLGVSALLGLAFNIIRIVVIAVASLKTDIQYGVIHEGLGSLVYLMALGAVFLLSRRTRKRSG